MAFVATVAPASAQAQSLFQALFGGGGPPLAHAPQVRTIPPSRLPALQGRSSGSQSATDQGQAKTASGSGGYRTVCVRTCDGYYWPVSANASRGRFYRDADICRSSCGMDAKLFYQAASARDANSLLDLQGRPYSRLQTAFLYRKLLVPGCACRPDPWSQASLDRHYRYALEAGIRAAAQKAAASSRVADALRTGASAAPARMLTGPAEPAASPNFADAAAADVDGRDESADRSKDEVTETSGAPAMRRAASMDVEEGGRPATVGTLPRAKPQAKRPGHAQRPVIAANKIARPVTGRTSAKPATAKSASLFGGGSSKYVWPGDQPTRYR